MEIQLTGLGVGGGLPEQVLWIPSPGPVHRKLEAAQQHLSQLLLGLQLDMQQMFEYRTRLMGVLGTLEQLKDPITAPPPTPLEQRVFAVGGASWQARPVGESFLAAPVQAVHMRRMLEYQRDFPPEEPPPVYRMAVALPSRKGSKNLGYDAVQLTPAGLQALQDPEQSPPVIGLRLPPRFPRQMEMLQLAKQKKRMGFGPPH